MLANDETEGKQHNTDSLGATLEELQVLEEAERERIKQFDAQHPFRLDTREERLFPGKYRSR